MKKSVFGRALFGLYFDRHLVLRWLRWRFSGGLYLSPYYANMSGRTESFPFPFLSQGNFGKFWKETFPRIFKSFPRFGKRLTKPFLLLLKPFLVDK